MRPPSELDRHLAVARSVADPLGIGFLALGMSPRWSLAETPVMPKHRYAIMARYMPKVGSRGLDMMFRTATVQANLDFMSERDMVAKMRVGLALQPAITALFANSPFTDGKLNGLLSARSEIWRHTDAARTGMLPFVFEPGMGFERYVDYALDVPMYFVKRGEPIIRCRGRELPRPARRPARASARASARRSPTGRTTCRRFSRKCGSSAISRCAAPTSARPSASSRSRR